MIRQLLYQNCTALINNIKTHQNSITILIYNNQTDTLFYSILYNLTLLNLSMIKLAPFLRYALLIITFITILISYELLPKKSHTIITNRGNCVKSKNNQTVCVHCHEINLDTHVGYALSLTNKRGLKLLLSPSSNEQIYRDCRDYSDIVKNYDFPSSSIKIELDKIPQIKKLILSNNLEVITSTSQVHLHNGNYEYVVVFQSNQNQKFETVFQKLNIRDSDIDFVKYLSNYGFYFAILIFLFKLYTQRKIEIGILFNLFVFFKITSESQNQNIFFTVNQFHLSTTLFIIICLIIYEIKTTALVSAILLLLFGYKFNNFALIGHLYAFFLITLKLKDDKMKEQLYYIKEYVYFSFGIVLLANFFLDHFYTYKMLLFLKFLQIGFIMIPLIVVPVALPVQKLLLRLQNKIQSSHQHQ